jgi:hypothetical protein
MSGALLHLFLLLDLSFMFPFGMILVGILGFFQLPIKVMSPLSLFNFNLMLKIYSLLKSNMCNLIRVANIALFKQFFTNVVFLIAFRVLTLANKMVQLNVNTIILLKLVLHSYLMPVFLFLIGMMHLSLPAI